MTEPVTILCETCNRPIEVLGRGRPPKYCDAACRQAAHRARKERERLRIEMPKDTARELRRYAENVDGCKVRRRHWLSDDAAALVEKARWLLIEAAELTDPSDLDLGA